jgi:hypothetical protein
MGKAPEVHTFDEDAIRVALEDGPQILRDFCKQLQLAIERQQEITNTAIRKIRTQHTKINKLQTALVKAIAALDTPENKLFIDNQLQPAFEDD